MAMDPIPSEDWARHSRLARSFYTRSDVVAISRDLLGKVLVTELDHQICAARIVETEAYRAPDDQACHAANHRRTARTETMYLEGGHAYIYLIYGIHHLFNVVTFVKEEAHAVLIRAVEPLSGLDQMMERRGFTSVKTQLTAGPGVLSRAMGLHRQFDGVDLCDPSGKIWIADDGFRLPPKNITIGTRVGVSYAGEDAFRPWRFSIKDNPWVSKAKGG